MNAQAPFCAQRISLQLTRLCEAMASLRAEMARVCQQLPAPSVPRSQ